jgi:hypothetical protein
MTIKMQLPLALPVIASTVGPVSGGTNFLFLLGGSDSERPVVPLVPRRRGES